MSAYLVVHATIKDSVKFKEYSESAAITFKRFGGELQFKGKVTDVLTGDHAFQMSAVIQFSDREAVNKWYQSTEYQDLIALRDRAADVVFINIAG